MTSNGAKVSYSKNVTEAMIEEEKAQMRLEAMMDELNRLEKVEKQKKEKNATQPKPKEKQPVAEKKLAKAPDAKKGDISSSEDDTEYEDNGEEARGYKVIFNNRIAAPTELKEEFLYFLMKEDWQDALKLCKFILMYEPDNAEAREFLPLLEQKASEEESEDEEEEDDDEDDEDEDDDSEDKSDNDDEDDDEDEDEDEDDNESIDEDKKKRLEQEYKIVREMYEKLPPTTINGNSSKQRQQKPSTPTSTNTSIKKK